MLWSIGFENSSAGAFEGPADGAKSVGGRLDKRSEGEGTSGLRARVVGDFADFADFADAAGVVARCVVGAVSNAFSGFG